MFAFRVLYYYVNFLFIISELKKSGKSKVAREKLTRAIKLAPDAKWVANARAQLKSLG